MASQTSLSCPLAVNAEQSVFLARSVLQDFRTGLSGAGSESLPNPDLILKPQLWAHLLKRLGRVDINAIERTLKLCGDAVYLVRTQNFEKADRAFELAELNLRRSPLFFEAHLSCRSFLSAAYAYKDYSLGSFPQAEQSLLASLSCEEELEVVYGYDMLHARRLHLVINMVKLHLRSGNKAKGLRLAGDALAYLNGETELISVGKLWSKEKMKRQDPQICKVLASNLESLISAELLSLPVDSATTNLDYVKQDNFSGGSRIQGVSLTRWLFLVELYLSGDHHGLMTQIPIFFQTGKAYHEGLWWSLVLAVSRSLVWSGIQVYKEAAISIASEATACGSIPADIRSLLLSVASIEERSC